MKLWRSAAVNCQINRYGLIYLKLIPRRGLVPVAPLDRDARKSCQFVRHRCDVLLVGSTQRGNGNRSMLTDGEVDYAAVKARNQKWLGGRIGFDFIINPRAAVTVCWPPVLQVFVPPEPEIALRLAGELVALCRDRVAGARLAVEDVVTDLDGAEPG